MKFLVDDIKQCWRWFSTWLIASSGTILIIYENVDSLKMYISDKAFHYIMLILVVLTFLGRVVKQNSVDQKK